MIRIPILILRIKSLNKLSKIHLLYQKPMKSSKKKFGSWTENKKPKTKGHLINMVQIDSRKSNQKNNKAWTSRILTSCPFRQKINLIGLIFGKGDIRVTHALVPRGYKYIYNLYAEGEAFGTYMWKAATEFQEKGYYVGYSPLTPNLSYVIETEWIYQLNSQAQRNVRHYSFLTNKDPYRELEAIFKDWYIKDKKDNPKKRMASGVTHSGVE